MHASKFPKSFLGETKYVPNWSSAFRFANTSMHKGVYHTGAKESTYILLRIFHAPLTQVDIAFGATAHAPPPFASQPMTNSFVSVPADLGQLNCAALVAGVIAGVLDGASFVSIFRP